MSHFTEGVLQAYLDQEEPADARAQVTGHVSDCADCAAGLQELRELNTAFSSAIGLLDARTLSTASLADLRQRAGQESRRDRWAGSRRTLSRAAILILGVTVAAVPGSPVRAWLVEAWKDLTTAEPVGKRGLPEMSPTPEVAPPTAFIVTPRSGRVQVILQSPAEGTLVRVALVDSDRAVLEASGGSATAKFRTSTGQIVMAGGQQGEVRISLPRTVDGTVEIDGRPYLVKQGEELRFVGTGEAQREGGAITFRTPK